MSLPNFDIKLAHKEAGNREFREGNYFGAIDQYSRGLAIDPHDIDLLSNRSLAYVNYGIFRHALQDAERALEINPNHLKCIHRRVKALWGLRRYDEAAGFLNSTTSNTLVDNPVFVKLKDQAEKFVIQSNGDYDILEMMNLAEGKCHEVAEFTGPLKIAPIPGKGHGLVATTDIQQGQLLICSKAFAITFGYEDKGDMYIEEKSVGTLVQSICERFALDTELSIEFGKLYDGQERVEGQESWVWTNADDDIVEQSLLAGVRSRIIKNSFSGDGNPNYLGLWILPSYFNHSCKDSNAHWVFCGDIMFVRALKPIASGEEVTIYYFAPESPDRIKTMQETYGFQCDCKLCQFESTEDEGTKQAVKSTLQSIKDALTRPKYDMSLVNDVKRVMSLRAGNPTFNLALLDPVIEQVTLRLYGGRYFEEAAEVLQAVRYVSVNTCHVSHAVQNDMTILSCYLCLKRWPDILDWIKILKSDLITVYGTVEVMTRIGTSLIEELEEFGGMDLLRTSNTSNVC